MEELLRAQEERLRGTMPAGAPSVASIAGGGSGADDEEDAPELRDQGDAWLASLYVVPEARGLATRHDGPERDVMTG